MSDHLLQPGNRIGNYILEQAVAKGAFAAIWKAVHHERPGRVIALKIATDASFRKQLSREGRLPDINHPNVVPILDADTRFAERPYIVMPYYPAGSLTDLIARHPAGLPEDRVDALLKDILSGLAAAHDVGIIHRDIKPGNVLIGRTGCALLSDFGLSLLHDGTMDARKSLIPSTSVSRERCAGLAGTIPYMAPELLNGRSPSPACDIYSVGILLFEMLTGCRPGGHELPSDRRAMPTKHSYWDQLFLGACAPAERRYSSASNMLLAVSGNLRNKKSGLPPRYSIARADALEAFNVKEPDDSPPRPLEKHQFEAHSGTEYQQIQPKAKWSWDSLKKPFDVIGAALSGGTGGWINGEISTWFRSVNGHHEGPWVIESAAAAVVCGCLGVAGVIVAGCVGGVWDSLMRIFVWADAGPRPATKLDVIYEEVWRSLGVVLDEKDDEGYYPSVKAGALAAFLAGMAGGIAYPAASVDLTLVCVAFGTIIAGLLPYWLGED